MRDSASPSPAALLLSVIVLGLMLGWLALSKRSDHATAAGGTSHDRISQGCTQ